MTFKVKQFLQYSLMKNPLYREGMEEVSKKIFSIWQYSVKDRFVIPCGSTTI